MKVVLVGLVLLCALTLVFAATGDPATSPKSTQATHESGQASDGQITTPAPSQSGSSAAVMSQTEADSLRVQGDSLMAQSSIGEIAVGNIGSDELIYILVVVLLVVLIVSVL